MSVRIRLARFLLALGDFIHTLPVVVMKPDDLVAFSRQSYSKPQDIESWSEDVLIESGLSDDELDLLAGLPTTTGNLLLLGVGGGREAIPLAKMGFHVTGVDFVAEMVDRAKENAARRGVSLEGMVQEISRLELPDDSYDVVWLSRAMYSCVPTRARRIEMVRRIARALKPGGFFLCQFHWNAEWKPTRIGEILRRLVAVCSLGNWGYEEGDILWLRVEFIHAFNSEEALQSELEEGGLSIIRLKTDQSIARGNAVCRRSPEPD